MNTTETLSRQNILISCLGPEDVDLWKTQLQSLLKDCVEDGASLGFLAPLSPEHAHTYWQGVQHDLYARNHHLLIATKGQKLLGSVQISDGTKPNGIHRAEIQKLMVYPQARRQGIARLLMSKSEDIARQNQRSLLVLDTRQGDVSEKLYTHLRFIKAGTIPYFVKNTTGQYESTVIYYKFLDPSLAAAGEGMQQV